MRMLAMEVLALACVALMIKGEYFGPFRPADERTIQSC